MKKKRSITSSYFFIIIAISYITVVILGSIAIRKQYSDFHKENIKLKKEYIEDQKIIIKLEIDEAWEYIEWRRKTAKISEKDLQNEVLEWFSKIRFPNRGDELGILFVRSYEGILLMSLSAPNLIGENISNKLDSDSINTHDLFLSAINDPKGGYAEYSWFNPTTETIGNKISFVKGIPEWQWYIGAGFWLNDINSVIEQEKLVMKRTVRSYVRIIILSMLILLIFIYISSSYLSRKMKDSFAIFSSFFNSAAIDSTKIDINKIEFSEFEKMASAANSMINAREQIEEELNISNRIINRSPAVAFLWRNEDNLSVEFVSDNVKYLLGYSAQEFMKGGIKYKKIIHKDDLPKVEKEVASYINDEKRKSFSLKPYRLITKTGEIKWVNDNSYIKRDSKGMITHYEGIIYDITELKKTEEKANRFNSIIADSLNEIYLFDSKSLLFIQVNNAALKNLGYSFDEILKLTPLDIKPEISAKSFEKLVKPLRKEEKEKIIFETTHQRKDKSLYNVEVHLQLLKYDSESLFAAIILDISDRKKAENELLESEARFRAMFENNHTVMALIDPESGKIIDTNPAAVKFYGYSRDKFINELYIHDLNTLSKEQVEKRMDEAKVRKQAFYNFEHRLFDGQIRNVEAYSGPISYEGKTVLFSIIHDVTEKIQIELELNKHRDNLEEIIKERTSELENSQLALLNLVDDVNQESEKLDQANKELANINEELETFTYSVSHDLKAPLRGIDGYSHLLLSNFKKEMDPEARVFLNNIRKSTKQMNVLIEDLLAYSRMERKDFRNEDIHFESLINDLLLHYSTSIETNNAKIKLSFPKKLKLKADKDGLNLVLRNLLDNALKFTSNKENAQIEISCSENSDNWHLFVKDNGIGFDMKYHDRIYKIFQRLHLAEEYEGTGVGLAMVSKAVQRMNGKIWAESSLSKGASFHIELYKS